MSRYLGNLSVLVVISVAIGGCGLPDETRSDDVLFLRTGAGVAVVKTGASQPSFRGSNAVPSSDWSTVIRSIRSRGRTRVVAQKPLSRFPRWDRSLTGRFFVKVVSHDGNLAALGPVAERDYRRGRARTTLAVHGSRLSEPSKFELRGNFEPEAFSSDGNSLFVIRYLPSRDPTRYQVRRLDLESGEIEAVYTPDAHLQRAMAGTARIQAGSSDGTRLYTLYTVSLGDGRRHAFVHVLSLDKLWAHCIDLPESFAEGRDSASAITVSPDGRHAYVANSAAGQAAEIDTQSLKVTRTTNLPFRTVGRTHAAVDRSSTLYLARGGTTVAIDATSFKVQRAWSFRSGITGLQVSTDAHRLFVGMTERVSILDLASGKVMRSIDPPGVGKISEFGPVIRPPRAPRSGFVCAC